MRAQQPPPPPFTCVQVPHARALPRLQPDLVPEEGDVGAGPLLHRGGVRELEVGQDHSSRAARQRAGVYLPGWVVVGWVWWWWVGWVVGVGVWWVCGVCVGGGVGVGWGGGGVEGAADAAGGGAERGRVQHDKGGRTLPKTAAPQAARPAAPAPRVATTPPRAHPLVALPPHQVAGHPEIVLVDGNHFLH